MTMKRYEDGLVPLLNFRRNLAYVLKALLSDLRDKRTYLTKIILRKEVIQPQVPLRLPWYDFTPVANPTVAACLPEGLAQRRRVEPTPMV